MHHMKSMICLTILMLAFSSMLFAKNDPTADAFYQAERAFEAYNFAQAEQRYRQVLPKYQQAKPMAAYVENQIAKCLRYQKKNDQAAAQYQKVKTTYPESPYAQEAQEAIARTYYEARNYEKAGPEFEKLADEKEADEQQAAAQAVSADSVGASKAKKNQEILAEEKQDAIGYAAYCYKQSGHGVKAGLAGMRWEKGKKWNEK